MEREIDLSKGSIREFKNGPFEYSSEDRELITVSLILENLAKALITALFKELFSQLFASKNSIDLSKFIKSLVDYITIELKKVIEDAFLNDHLSRLNALRSIYIKYINAPSEDRLSSCTELGEIVVAQLKGIGLAGHHGFLAASSINMGIIEERVKIYGEEEKINLRQTLEDSIEGAISFEEEWLNWLSSRFSWWYAHSTNPFVGLHYKKQSWTLYFDGKPYQTEEMHKQKISINVLQEEYENNPNIKEEKLNAAVSEKFNRELKEKYIDPSVRVRELWAEKLLTL